MDSHDTGFRFWILPIVILAWFVLVVLNHFKQQDFLDQGMESTKRIQESIERLRGSTTELQVKLEYCEEMNHAYEQMLLERGGGN